MVLDQLVVLEKFQVGMVSSLRSAFYISSCNEPSQAEGVNSTILSCVVGDVTIELERLIEVVPPDGIDIGDFTEILLDVDTQTGPVESLRYSRDELSDMLGLRIDEKQLSDIQFESCFGGVSEERLIELNDKHGVSQVASDLGFAFEFWGSPLALGMRNR